MIDPLAPTSVIAGAMVVGVFAIVYSLDRLYKVLERIAKALERRP